MNQETILLSDSQRIKKEFLIPLHRQEEKLKKRCYIEDVRARSDGEYQRDYTRILYSSSFRRLQGKMQLFAVQSDQFIRNRLTHSLEVAQIARSIAGIIGYDPREIYVVEACSLAHDIGNPGFGHAGERFLNLLSREFGGFEGNAQTFRILTTVEQKRSNFQGLNLTYRTLLGVLKYYNRFNPELPQEQYGKQKFIYDSDYELVGKILQETQIKLRTLDVQIVDLADEIAYAAHDLEDGLRLGILKTDEVLHDFCSIVDNKVCQEKLEEIFDESRYRAGFKNPGIDSAEYAKLYCKEIASRVINTLINDIGIVELSQEQKSRRGSLCDSEIGFVSFSDLASGLKGTVYQCVTKTNQVYAYENAGKFMFQELFTFYMEHPQYLPPEYRAGNIVSQYPKSYKDTDQGKLQKRLVIDYISGMMDEFVRTNYGSLEPVIRECKSMKAGYKWV